ncbi:ribosome biogenesis protein BRX1 homolog isoform X2 [Hyposmocoma kahamanoa]|uniref:ribosome biogenesis protein BRX1 homolog isoform X2 n=1 Tax=Hyposmocoma kahamanoa TaxID=1477025 RepID=UPI000E6DA406|nr:ribosome biogenesis protein BRX1 homolog isoform X2 [Hyposmocoma kahamanoa]
MTKLKAKKSKTNKKQTQESKKEDENVVVLPPVRMSDDPTPKQVKWINRQRVLVFAARGINHRHRHLMEDIKKLMPHHKTESKMERSKNLYIVNEISEMKNCNKCILFEGRKMRDLYMWMANIPNGPSVKFLVENIYTMGELKMTGNCLRGSRPLLSFDPQFTKDAHYNLLKELLTQIFGVPYHHPKSQPFFDHVYSFMILDNRIWFRNYQILSEDGALAEIGPRFVLNPVKIFSGSFGGGTLWENPKYVSPAKLRQAFSKKAANKYEKRIEQKVVYEATRPETAYPDIEGPEFFKGDPLEKAQEVLMKEVKEEDESMADSEPELPSKPVFSMKKAKNRPDKVIRRKQLKAKSKAISDQIKKRKHLLKKKKPTKG